jgi:hypothetical protein
VTLQLTDLVEQLARLREEPGGLNHILSWARSMCRNEKLEDDLSILQITF